MTTSLTLVRMFDRSWAACFHGLDACRKRPSRGAVHALRIATQRLQALIDVLGHATEAPPKALDRLARMVGKPMAALSPLRDDQVQCRGVAQAAGGRGMLALLDHLRHRKARHEKRARRVLVRIDRVRAEAVARRVRGGVVPRQGAPTRSEQTLLLLTAVDAAATDVRRRLARLDADAPRTLHKLRIAIKRFRYICEIAEEVSPQVHVASQAILRSLQRRLGMVHDADVLIARIDGFVGRRRRHREDVRAFKKTIEVTRARNLRGLSRSLPALRHALTDLAVRPDPPAAPGAGQGRCTPNSANQSI